MRCSVFFFQAEDGIRDLVRSRGLGDVYKRQVVAAAARRAVGPSQIELIGIAQSGQNFLSYAFSPVSYTHLTLPTSDLV